MYCSIDDVAVFCGYQTFSETTTPTAVQVEDIIKIISDEIDYFIKLKNIEIDKTDDKTISLLKLYCIMGASAILLRTYLNNNQSSGSMLEGYENRYRDFINNMKKYFMFFQAAGMD